MNIIQQLKDTRAKLVTELETIDTKLAPSEAMLKTDALDPAQESTVELNSSDRKQKTDTIKLEIHKLDQKIVRLESLADRESLMAGYIADMANWVADELELNVKRESLSTRLEEVRKQSQEEIASARHAETQAATAYAQAVAWGDLEGEKAASSDAQKAAKNLTTATEQHRRQQLIIAALEQELATVDHHINEAQEEHQKIERKALHLAHDALEEKWNEAAQELLDAGGKLYAAARLIDRDPVSLLKLDIPEQDGNFGSWKWCDLTDRASRHHVKDLFAM